MAAILLLASALRVVTRGCSAVHQRSPTPCNTRNDSLRVRLRSRWPMPLEALPVDHPVLSNYSVDASHTASRQ
jgi:hypothetical protein